MSRGVGMRRSVYFVDCRKWLGICIERVTAFADRLHPAVPAIISSGGRLELVKEGLFPTATALFTMLWIFTYSALHFGEAIQAHVGETAEAA